MDPHDVDRVGHGRGELREVGRRPDAHVEDRALPCGVALEGQSSTSHPGDVADRWEGPGGPGVHVEVGRVVGDGSRHDLLLVGGHAVADGVHQAMGGRQTRRVG